MYITKPKKLHFDPATSVEQVCELGCVRVKKIIRSAQAGERPDELAHLGADERHAVIEELVSIMSVYDRDC